MFSKLALLTKITDMGDFATLQYIAQNVFAIPNVVVWVLTIAIYLIVAYTPRKPNHLIAFFIAMAFQIVMQLLIYLYPILPSILTIS